MEEATAQGDSRNRGFNKQVSVSLLIYKKGSRSNPPQFNIELKYSELLFALK
jgi:hypothetical protein